MTVGTPTRRNVTIVPVTWVVLIPEPKPARAVPADTTQKNYASTKDNNSATDVSLIGWYARNTPNLTGGYCSVIHRSLSNDGL